MRLEMNNCVLRHIASILLLATYLPMAVLSSLHVHHETIDVHDDCLQCVGHIETAHHHDHDCLYCIFLGLNYFVHDEGQMAVLFPTMESLSTPTPAVVPLIHCGMNLLRAPPTVE